MDLPRRKRIRLSDYDYSAQSAYFITIRTKDRRSILSDIAVGTIHNSPISPGSSHHIKGGQKVHLNVAVFDLIGDLDAQAVGIGADQIAFSDGVRAGIAGPEAGPHFKILIGVELHLILGVVHIAPSEAVLITQLDIFEADYIVLRGATLTAMVHDGVLVREYSDHAHGRNHFSLFVGDNSGLYSKVQFLFFYGSEDRIIDTLLFQ